MQGAGVLRLQIERCLPALPIERYRTVLMGDRPRAVDLAKADGRAQPHVDLASVRRRPADSVEAVREGHVIAYGDAQVAHLEADRALKRGQPRLGAPPRLIYADALQRVHDVERQDVRGLA